MAVTTYQVNRDLRGSPQVQNEAFRILSEVASNAPSPTYNLTIQDVSLDGSGRLRIRLSNSLPAEEVESFAGDIIAI
jgi:hypothetical protein